MWRTANEARPSEEPRGAGGTAISCAFPVRFDTPVRTTHTLHLQPNTPSIYLRTITARGFELIRLCMYMMIVYQYKSNALPGAKTMRGIPGWRPGKFVCCSYSSGTMPSKSGRSSTTACTTTAVDADAAQEACDSVSFISAGVRVCVTTAVCIKQRGLFFLLCVLGLMGELMP